MRFFIFILVFSGLCFTVFGQKSKRPVGAPINPEYIKALQKMESGEVEDLYVLPYSPSFHSLSAKSNNTTNRSLPAAYDMRTAGPAGTSLVTPIKNQGSCGSCWAFSSLGAIEATWMLQGLGEFDLSENNVKNCHGFVASPCGYGSNFHPSAMFARGDGPYLEADDPYSVSNGTCLSGLTPVSLLTQIQYVPPDVQAMKEAIYNHGGVSVPLRLAYIDPDNNTQFNSLITTTNHLVVLVGWDDNIKVTGGWISGYPPHGAFIAKNSYGTGWGESGYFYISYNDIHILDYGVCWPGWDDYTEGTEVYTHSKLGSFYSTGYNDPTDYGLVKFNIDSDKQLVRLGTFVNAAMAEITFEVYDDFDPVNLILSNKITELKNEYCHYPGYYTFELPVSESIPLADDIFIKVKYYTPGYPQPVPIESYYAGFMDPEIETNVCWISDDGTDGSWYLVGDDIVGANYDLCIYAYTESSSTWQGTTTDWANAANWSNGIPDVNTYALIPNTGNQPIISWTENCRGVVIETNASLTISPAGNLSIEKELQLGGSLNKQGTLAINSASNITFRGNVAQQMDAAIGGVENLTIDNPNGITLNNNLIVSNMLNLKAGSITPGTFNISYGDKAMLKYSGLSSQTTSNAAFPATNGPSILYIDNSVGLTLHASRSIDSTLILENGTFNNSTNNLTLSDDQDIIRYAGSLSAAPIFGSSINLNYRSSTSITTGFEIPSASSVVQKVWINCPAIITLNSNISINHSLELNTGLLSNSASSVSMVSGTSIIDRSGDISNAPIFNSSVDLFYLAEIADVTGAELPTSSTVLRDVTIHNSKGILLNANATINENLYLIGGIFDNSSFTLTFANNSNINIQPGLLDGAYGDIGQLSSKPTANTNINLNYSGRYYNSIGLEMPDEADGTLNHLSMNNYSGLTFNKDISAKGDVEVRGRINMLAYSITGTGNLQVKRGATLYTQHPNGMNLLDGSIQLSGTRIYNDTIDFRFEGANDQVMGTHIPPVMRHLFIYNSSTGGVTLRSKNIRVIGHMMLEPNSLFTIENARTLFND